MRTHHHIKVLKALIGSIVCLYACWSIFHFNHKDRPIIQRFFAVIKFLTRFVGGWQNKICIKLRSWKKKSLWMYIYARVNIVFRSQKETFSLWTKLLLLFLLSHFYHDFRYKLAERCNNYVHHRIEYVNRFSYRHDKPAPQKYLDLFYRRRSYFCVNYLYKSNITCPK